MKKSAIIIVALCLLLAGCKTSKTVLSPMAEWNTMEIPFKLNIDGSMSPSGKAYFERDKSLYLSIRFLGMEMMAVFANNDSVFIYDKSNKILLADRLGDNPLTGKPLDVNQLQDFLLGIDSYGTPLSFSMESINIDIVPEETSMAGNQKQAAKWFFTVAHRYNGRKISGNLLWNYASAQTGNQNLPQWKRPKNPKTVLKINNVNEIINAQF